MIKQIKAAFFILTSSFVTVFLYIFMKAYQNGGKIIVDINANGEMYLEAIIILIYFVLLILITIIDFKDLNKIEE